MKNDLFSKTRERAEKFAQSIWLCQLVAETIENLKEYEEAHEAAIKSNDAEEIKQTRLQLDATIASLQLTAYLDESFTDQQ
tara:strand:+ start:262 stop:504 length:243 start_codon:yes stop_codon:yes gene_type:complete